MTKHSIRFDDGLKEEMFVCGEEEFVLGAMFRTGKGGVSRYGCHGGGCGFCKMRVVSGMYEVAKRMSRAHITPEEEAQGIILACCIQPRGALMLQKV